jgi:hypothetical protein
MKGATAEPWVSTINIPSSAIIAKTGHNQNFFLARKNFQSSIIIDMAAS